MTRVPCVLCVSCVSFVTYVVCVSHVLCKLTLFRPSAPQATERSVRWLDRCIAAHSRKKEQNLFGIIQGGLDFSPGGMREYCIEEMVKRDLPGYAIGMLACACVHVC